MMNDNKHLGKVLKMEESLSLNILDFVGHERFQHADLSKGGEHPSMYPIRMIPEGLTERMARGLLTVAAVA